MLVRSVCIDTVSLCDGLVLCGFSVEMFVRTPCYRTYKRADEFSYAFRYNVVADEIFGYRPLRIPKYKIEKKKFYLKRKSFENIATKRTSHLNGLSLSACLAMCCSNDRSLLYRDLQI